MESFLSPSDIVSLEGDVGDAWATGLAIQEGGTEVVFAFIDAMTQERTYTAPQTVTIAWPKGNPKVLRDVSGEEATVDVYLKHPEPFDCKKGYTFGFGPVGEEQRGKILMVYPASLGIVRAIATLST